MSEWIRHRGSKSMPKCLEGKIFEVRHRDGVIAEYDGKGSWYWDRRGNDWDIFAFRILGDIEQPKTAIELQTEEVGIPEPVQEWPEDRIDIIGQNGNDGLAYEIDTSPEHVENDEEIVHMPTTAPDFLQSALNTLTQRGKDYDKPEGERSAAAVAVAFNAITGRNLTEAEVWLVLQLVKDVRQWQNPDRYHADSALDCVAYAALKAEALAASGK